MPMTRTDFALIAATLKNEKPLINASSYYDMSDYDQGRYDEWYTTVLAFVRLCRASSNRDRNGNSVFDNEKFLRACDATELLEAKVTPLRQG